MERILGISLMCGSTLAFSFPSSPHSLTRTIHCSYYSNGPEQMGDKLVFRTQQHKLFRRLNKTPECSQSAWFVASAGLKHQPDLWSFIRISNRMIQADRRWTDFYNLCALNYESLGSSYRLDMTDDSNSELLYV